MYRPAMLVSLQQRLSEVLKRERLAEILAGRGVCMPIPGGALLTCQIWGESSSEQVADSSDDFDDEAASAQQAAYV